MLFSKYIKNKPVYNKIAILLINGLLRFYKIIKPIDKNVTNRIVIIALHKLGDSVFTLRAVENIIQSHKKNIMIRNLIDLR